MHWFQGSIPEAIAEAKRKKAVFMVYISGDDERSRRMNGTYESDEVIEKLEQFGCVAVNLEGNSEVCQQFSQIYPVVLIPSSYFIGSNGMLLEIIGGDLSTEEFLTKIETILQPTLEQSEGAPPTSVAITKSAEQSVGSLPSNDTQENNTSNELEPAAAPNVLEGAESYSSVAPSAASHSNVNVEERVERAKQLLMQQKEQKAKLQMEEEKQREMERRKTGQDVQKLRHRQQEADNKQLADDLARDRAEEKAARDRIKEQIATDRAERAAKYQADKQESERVRTEAKQNALKEQQERAAIEAAEKSDFARLQFRFPDGSSLTHQFLADDTLATVRLHVEESSRMSRSFTLSTTFPRREFQESDYDQTLRDLRLAPCSAILVLPRTTVATSNNYSFIWSLLGPILAIFNYLRMLIFGEPSRRSSARAKPSAANKRNNDEDSSSSSKEAKTDGSHQNVHKRRSSGKPGSSFSRREGNIHRISNQDDDDEDDNNTWNGNSTQQM